VNSAKIDVQDKVAPRSFASLRMTDGEAVRKLLDVVSFIIADEYIEIAKQNKDVFEIAAAPVAPRNDDDEGHVI